MNSRNWLIVLALLVSLLGFSVASLAVTLAQDSDSIYLPLIANNKPNNTQPTPTATAPETSNPWAPPPTATATAVPNRVYPTWVPGTYNIRSQRLEAWGEYSADGTFSEQGSTFGIPGINQATGEWFVTNDEMVVEFTDQTGQSFQRRYLIEQIADEGFRLAAGDAKLSAYFYEHATPIEGIGGQRISQWVPGRWDAVGVTFYAFFFNEDGTYDLYETSPFGVLETQIEEGNWNAWADQMIIQPLGAILANSTYTITNANYNYLKLTNKNTAGWSLFRKTWYPSASMDDFSGQYIAGNMTVIVKKVTDTSYTATILINGVLTQATGTVDEYGRLVLRKSNGETYQPLQRHFNGLVQDTLTFPNWLTKVSQTVLPMPVNAHGLWVDNNSSINTELWLLADGRYVESNSFYIERGTYNILGDTITQDPLCSAPYSRTATFVENQMLLSAGNKSTLFQYVPGKLSDLSAQVAAWEDAEAIANEAFANKTRLALTDQTYISPVDLEVSVDPGRSNIYANATVFDDAQLYYWFDSVTYYIDTKGGALVGVTPVTCTIFNCSTLDFSRSWHNKFHYYFFPNGRYQIYFETYYDATSTMPVTPNIQRWWGKYKIQSEVILTESDTGELFERKLALGRRQAMQGETCLDNVAAKSK